MVILKDQIITNLFNRGGSKMKTVKAIVLIFVSLIMLISPAANADDGKDLQFSVAQYVAVVMGANQDEGKLLAIHACQKKPILIKSTTKNVFGQDAWVLEPNIWV